MEGLKVKSGSSHGESLTFLATHPFAHAYIEEQALCAELQMHSFSPARSLVETNAVKAGSLFEQMSRPPIEAGETGQVTWTFSSLKCCSNLPQSGLTAQKCITSEFWKIKAKMGVLTRPGSLPFFLLASEICWPSVVCPGFSRFLRGVHSKSLFLKEQKPH